MHPVSLLLFGFLSAGILSACGSAEDTRPRIKVGNHFDIPLLDGSSLTESCDAVVRRDLTSDITDYACVALPAREAGIVSKGWDSDYLRAAWDNGWTPTTGAANIFWFEKPVDDNCNYQMGLMGSLETSKDWNNYLAGESYNDDAMTILVFFQLPDNQVCGADRKL